MNVGENVKKSPLFCHEPQIRVETRTTRTSFNFTAVLYQPTEHWAPLPKIDTEFEIGITPIAHAEDWVRTYTLAACGDWRVGL